MTDRIVIDAEGLKCPLPVLKLQKALDPLSAGTEVELRATDENAATDVPAVCRSDGHTVLAQSRDGAVIVFAIRKG